MVSNFTIGKMAKMNNVSEQTLRLYDKMHLLEPCEINEETGYRYYNIKQCAQLDMIQYLKALGLNLHEIRACLGEGNTQKLRERLEQHHSVIEAQIKEILHTKHAIERALENYKRYDAVLQEGAIVQEYQRERRIFVYDTKINCYSYGMEYYENILRSLKKSCISHKMPLSYFCNVGSILRKEYFVKKELFATEVILFVEDDFDVTEKIELIPEGVFLCVYCNGYHREEESLKKLMEHIGDNNYEIMGDCISEILIEFPNFTHYDRNAFFKLQIPVRKRDALVK